jgi:hypothetical protein
MDVLTHEVQVRLGVEIEDESALAHHHSLAGDAPPDTEQAIVRALTNALDSRVFRDLLAECGLAVRRGEVRIFSQHASPVLPGAGLDPEVGDPLGT